LQFLDPPVRDRAASAPVKVTLCSANEEKLVEVREALPDWEIDPLDESDYPEEDGATYVENARIKARYGRSVGPPDRWMLADDSGLELAALDGRPGVQTARWAEGRHVERALAALEGAGNRSGRYVAELVLLSPDGQELRGTGVLEGTIAREPAGDGGFGFDPVFVPRGETKTVAERGDAWKAVHSHRALGAKALVERVLHLTSGV
jgi:XTP/dITP diphosphohydrolase